MLIKVKAFPGSKKQEIIKKSKDSFDIKVKSKPIQGMGNKEIIKILAEYFKTSENKIRFIKGWKQRNKIIEIID